MWYIKLINGDLISIRGRSRKKDGVPTIVFTGWDSQRYWEANISKSIAKKYKFSAHPDKEGLFIIDESKVEDIIWRSKSSASKERAEIYFGHEFIEQKDGTFKSYINGFNVSHLSPSDKEITSSILKKCNYGHRIIYVNYGSKDNSSSKRIEIIKGK